MGIWTIVNTAVKKQRKAKGSLTTTYTYDAYGNRTALYVTDGQTAQRNVSYQYDLSNQLLVSIGQTGTGKLVSEYTYDRNGNTLKRLGKYISGAASGVVDLSLHGTDEEMFSYNGLNQMIAYHNGASSVSYVYQTDGLRWAKTLEGVTTSHVWDYGNMVMDTAPSGNAKLGLRLLGKLYITATEESLCLGVYLLGGQRGRHLARRIFIAKLFHLDKILRPDARHCLTDRQVRDLSDRKPAMARLRA
jgi:YD repeat-containing protein